MKKIIALLIIISFVSISSFAALPNKVDQTKSKNNLIQDNSIAYSINYYDAINQKTKNFDVKYVSENKYFKNKLHIKTKSISKANKNGNILLSSSTSSLLSKYGNYKLTQPYPKTPNNLNSIDVNGLDRIYEVIFSNEINPYQLCKELMKNSEIEYAAPIFKRDIHLFTPDDPLLYQQWWVNNVQAKNAWDISKGDTNVVIAICDNGTEWSHEDLAANIWVNRKEIPGNGKDDDGNGKIDDIRGWDMVGNVSYTQISAGQYQEDNDPKNPSQSHGTHTAGCASAVTNNTKGIASLGFSCRIMPVKCASDNASVDGVFRGYDAIYYAANSGAKVINCSWGGEGSSPAEQDVINFAISKGALVVASSGNSGLNNDIIPSYPACYEGVLSVGSYNRSNLVSSFSNYGNSVKVYGPGENIYSTMPGNLYANQSGTSMSSPVVAGLAALVYCIHPTWTPEQVSAQIRSTCDDAFSTSNPMNKVYYVGKINANKALQYNNPNYPSLVVPGIIGKDLSINGDVALKNSNATLISLSLLNYLGKADTLKVDIVALDSYIDILDKSFVFYNFATLTTKDLQFNVQLLPNNPWFDGNARVLVKYSSGTNYVDYQIVTLPIKISSTNRYVNFEDIPIEYSFRWHGIHPTSDDLAWACGESPYLNGAVAKLSPSGSTLKQAANETLYAIYGFNSNKAIAGSGPTSGAANIYTTTDGGSFWSTSSISNVTPFVNGFCFFDANNGLMLGDPLSGYWGIASTTDAGTTWNKLSGVPAPATSETGFVECIYQNGNKIWFGTSQGRVYVTKDRGATWAIKTIYFGGSTSIVAFSDDNNGMGVYQEDPSTSQTPTRYLTSTTDGGNTWTQRQLDLNANNLSITEIYPLPNSSAFAVVFADGQIMKTTDLGTNWYPILSKDVMSVQVANGRYNNNKVRIWGGGLLNLGYLEFSHNATDVEILNNDKFNIYPNPAVNSINVFLNSNKAIKYELYNCFGEKVKYDDINISGNLLNINTSELSSGIYLIKLINADDTFQSEKIILSK